MSDTPLGDLTDKMTIPRSEVAGLLEFLGAPLDGDISLEELRVLIEGETT